MVHQFTIHQTNMALDVNSGALHVLDDCAARVLSCYNQNGSVNIDKLNNLKKQFGKKCVEEAQSELEYLKGQGLLFTKDDYEGASIGSETVVKALCLHIAHDCNLACKYCFAGEGSYHGQNSLMPLEVGVKAIDFVIDNSGNRRNLEIDFFGGEPLLNMETVKGIVNYARKREKESNKHFRFTITTNGLLLNEVIRDLMEYKGISEQTARDMIYNSGLKIYTTLEPKVQNTLDSVFQDETYFPKVNEEAKLREEIPQAAMVVIDPSTGAVRGLYGGYGKKEGSVFNRATQMRRSPGSTIKPLLIYGPGIETGRITAATIVDDVPQHMRLYDTTIPEEERQQLYPRNVEKVNFGLTTVRTGLVNSRNVVAALLLRDFTTFDVGLTYLEKVNMPRWEDNGKISISMGGFTNRMSPLEMAAAYSVFAYKGMYWEPYFYTRIEDYNGNVILEKNPSGTKVYSEQTSFIVNDLLQEVVLKGTGTGCLVKNKNGQVIPTMGKTGTADKSIDKWFCGGTPYYVAAAWYGYDNRQVPISIVSAESNNAKNIWHAVMTKIHENLEPMPFFSSIPGRIVTRKVCIDSGKLATSLCEHDPRGSRVTEEYFIEGTEPEYGEICNVHIKAKVCTASTDEYGRPVPASEYCPAETVQERIFIRRPVKHYRLFPTDPLPLDWIYEINENITCTVHNQANTPVNNQPADPGTGLHPSYPDTGQSGNETQAKPPGNEVTQPDAGQQTAPPGSGSQPSTPWFVTYPTPTPIYPTPTPFSPY
jgi:membrane peptidoglycan carboxypeptidase